MANRYPLVANASTLVIEEITASDTVVIDNFKASNTANLGAIGNITITGGSTGQVIKTNGSGTLSWSNDNSTPAGSNTYVQFNDGGTALGATANLTFDKSSSNLTITGNIIVTGTGKSISANTLNMQTGTIGVKDINVSNTVIFSNSAYAIFNSSDNSTKFAALAGPSNIAGANGTYVAWALPATAGNVGEYLTSNGGGQMQWVTAVSSSAPGSAGAIGQAGTLAYDSGYLYICVAANTWKRVAVATWP
jgi:hypothetical protein